MIIQDLIEITVNSTSLKYYKDIGYDAELNKKTIVRTDDLSKSSCYEVMVKCDYCGNEKMLKYCKYIKNIKHHNIYCCSNKCAYQLKNKKTNVEKYGVDSFSKTDDYKLKFKKMSLKNYGFDNPSKNFNIRKKISENKFDFWKNKLKEEYNVISINNHNYEMKCDCGKDHNFFIDRDVLHNRKQLKTILCTICHPIKSYFNSGMEINVRNYICDNYYNEILFNSRLLGKELDIYVPKLKLAFEFNGVYWHNEMNKPNNYHQEKTELCEKNNIQLIHIYEDDWLYKNDIVKSMILSKLGKTENKIESNKCEIREITDNKLVREFLEKNHIQGFIGSSVKIGHFHKNELLSLMTFGKRRKKNTEDEYELLRFCNRLNTNVIDSRDKLFKYFVKNYSPKMIITYSDRSWDTGDLYRKLGFEFIGKTQPNYYYVIDRIKHHRFNYRKDKLIKEGFDKNKSEHEIMLGRGIYRIYDSGNLKFEYID